MVYQNCGEFLVIAPAIATNVSGSNFGTSNFMVLMVMVLWCQVFGTGTSLFLVKMCGIYFIFPLSIIIILYAQVFVIAKKHATAIRELNNHTRPKTQKITSHSMKSERKAAKVLSILVSVFLVCLLPYFIYSLLGNVIEIQAETLLKVLVVIHLNSTINPFIYALFYSWFRRCIHLILTLRIFQTDSALVNILS